MTARALAAVALLALAGCNHEDMPKDQMFAEIKQCRDHGMDYGLLVYASDGAIERVQCLPKGLGTP